MTSMAPMRCLMMVFTATPGMVASANVSSSCKSLPALRRCSKSRRDESVAVDLLDALDSFDYVGNANDLRRWDIDEEEQPTGASGGYNDVAADYIAHQLAHTFPDVKVPVRLQHEWLQIPSPTTAFAA